MPGVLGVGWRSGNRAEYLAQYFLSALGASAPVIRQEDVGIDFYCALAKEEAQGRLTFHSPFTIQNGSATGKQFVFGGMDSKGKWRKTGIEWLFSQELPFFVSTIDRVAQRFRIYSTSPMWLTHYEFSNPTEIILVPDATHDPVKKVRSRTRIRKRGIGDGYKYRVPLRAPIVDLTVADLERTQLLKRARRALEIAISVESRNLTYKLLGLHAATWLTDPVPNSPASLKGKGGGFSCSEEKPRGELLRAFRDMCIILALNLKARKQKKRIEILAHAFRLIPRRSVPEWAFKELPSEIQNVLR